MDLILAWGPTKPGDPADVNEDGEVNVLDLVEVILAWGQVRNEYQLELLSRDG